MSKIKLISLDLDGTLLNKQHQISPGNYQAIKKAQEAGVLVTISTGRMFQSAAVYARQLGLTSPLITYQGAYVRAVSEQKPMLSTPLNAPQAREIIDLALEAGLRPQAYVDDTLCVAYINQQAVAYTKMAGVPLKAVGDLRCWLAQDIHKILIEGEPDILEKVWKTWRDYFGDKIYLTKSRKDFLEAAAPTANKGWALTQLSQKLGLNKQEIMVCGDSYNDLTLFEAAGLKIAMDNAVDQLKQGADYITAACDDDGVCEAIEKFVL